MPPSLSEKARKRKADMELALGSELFTWSEVRELAPTAAMATLDVVEHWEPWHGRERVLEMLRRRTGRTLWRLEGGRAWRARWPRQRFEPQTCCLCGIAEAERLWYGLCYRCRAWISTRDPYQMERTRERVALHRERKRHNSRHPT